MNINDIPDAKAVLLFLYDRHPEPQTGAMVSRGIKKSVYLTLVRLNKLGFVLKIKEDIDPQREERPPRTFYSLTGKGLREAYCLRLRQAESTDETERGLPPSPATG